MTTVEIAKLQNCERPLNEEERGAISVGWKWATLESASIVKKAPTQEEGEEKVAMTVTTSPTPAPPKAPSKFAAGQICQSRLGGKDTKGKAPKGDHKGKDCK